VGRQARPPAARPPAVQPATDTRLEFAAAYRRVIEQERRYPVLFFVHRPDARETVRAMIERRAPQLGGAPQVSHGAAAQEIESGTTLTIVPNVLGATFEPSHIDVSVDDSVRELTFQMAVAPDGPLGPLDGYIDIFVGPLIIGQVAVGFEVHAATPIAIPRPSDDAQFLAVANASIFDKIFVSYSRRDSAVVDLCVSTYQGLGVTVLVDRLDLRSGDDWRNALERMIEESDIFQLYWSSAAAASQEVHHEWRQALALSKIRNRFIRPLYWETPMPSPPEALGHLHFSRLDLKLLRRAAKAHAQQPAGLLRRAIAAVFGK
jgi:TIR domain